MSKASPSKVSVLHSAESAFTQLSEKFIFGAVKDFLKYLDYDDAVHIVVANNRWTAKEKEKALSFLSSAKMTWERELGVAYTSSILKVPNEALPLDAVWSNFDKFKVIFNIRQSNAEALATYTTITRHVRGDRHLPTDVQSQIGTSTTKVVDAPVDMDIVTDECEATAQIASLGMDDSASRPLPPSYASVAKSSEHKAIYSTTDLTKDKSAPSSVTIATTTDAPKQAAEPFARSKGIAISEPAGDPDGDSSDSDTDKSDDSGPSVPKGLDIGAPGGNGGNGGDGGDGGSGGNGGDNGGPGDPGDNNGDEDAVNLNVNNALADLWSMDDPVRLDLIQVQVIIRAHEFSPEGVARFIRDNTLDPINIRDIAYAVIILKLVEVEIIEVNVSERQIATYPTDDDVAFMGDIDLSKVRRFSVLAKVMLIAALHAYSQGGLQDTINWYQSFINVKGAFLTENRFVAVVRLIIANGKLGEIFKLLTVGDIISENKVFKYRITRISTPNLIRIAVTAIRSPLIIQEFDTDALRTYKAFDQAGILAQLVAGPLSVFCKGKFNTLGANRIPHRVKLAELAPIENAPYHEPTIRKAYIILEEIQYPFGKWYQGMKAMKSMTAEDVKFRSLVKAVIARIREAANAIVIADNDIPAAAATVLTENANRNTDLVSNWMSSV